MPDTCQTEPDPLSVITAPAYDGAPCASTASTISFWVSGCHLAELAGEPRLSRPGDPFSPARGEPRRGCFGFNCRMVVIFGFGPGSPDDQGEVAPCVCPNCHNQVFLHHVRSKKSVRLYFVPVVPYGTDNYLVCPVCSQGLQVSDAQLRHVRSMASATASFRAGRLPQARYMAQAEQFWRQLGVNPAGQQLVTRPAPVLLGARRQLRRPDQPPLPRLRLRLGLRPWPRRARCRGFRTCTSWRSCMTRASCSTLTMRRQAAHPRQRAGISRNLRPSGNPFSGAHQGTPGQLIGFPPCLDPLRAQHQEPHLAARLARVPVCLPGIPPGQASRDLLQAVDLFQVTSIITTSRVGPRPSRARLWLMMFLAVTEPASVANTTRSSTRPGTAAPDRRSGCPPASAAAVATHTSAAGADSLASVSALRCSLVRGCPSVMSAPHRLHPARSSRSPVTPVTAPLHQ